jgi:two-component system, sensor histidine kinase and response regulator
MAEKDKAEILIVEDSPTQAERLSYILEGDGYRTSIAANGKAALDLLARRSPTIVLSDIIMPEMDGFELCRKIKADDRLRGIPVILLTALSEPEDVLKGLECGADNFITKPYDGKYLLVRIHHALLNAEMRETSKLHIGDEIFFMGKKYSIGSERQQILDILLSTYETAVMKNQQLKQAQEELTALNESLEKKVEERTSALLAQIEERKRAEQEIMRLNRDLERRVAERTAQLREANMDLDSFNYSISHDLKAPLRTIGNFSSILIEDNFDKLDPESRDLLKAVSDNSKKMRDLIDDMLVFSRAGTQDLTLVEVDMDALVGAVVGELKAACQGRDITFDIGKLPPAYGDRSAIKQVFSNLLGNAVKFTRPKASARIDVGAEDGANEHIYYVRDNGVGFDDAYTHKLFGVFERLHTAEEFEGTGIGLAIVQRYVGKLGGRVWAEGEKGRGATFYFTLPARSAAAG